MIYLDFLKGPVISDISYSVQSIYLICNDDRNYRLSYSNNDSLNTMINVGFPRSHPTIDMYVDFLSIVATTVQRLQFNTYKLCCDDEEIEIILDRCFK